MIHKESLSETKNNFIEKKKITRKKTLQNEDYFIYKDTFAASPFKYSSRSTLL